MAHSASYPEPTLYLKASLTVPVFHFLFAAVSEKAIWDQLSGSFLFIKFPCCSLTSGPCLGRTRLWGTHSNVMPEGRQENQPAIKMPNAKSALFTPLAHATQGPQQPTHSLHFPPHSSNVSPPRVRGNLVWDPAIEVNDHFRQWLHKRPEQGVRVIASCQWTTLTLKFVNWIIKCSSELHPPQNDTSLDLCVFVLFECKVFACVIRLKI